MPDGATRRAELHRMATAEHICPDGFKTLDLLKREGFEVEDHKLTSRLRATALSVGLVVRRTVSVYVRAMLFSAPAGDQARHRTAGWSSRR